MKKSTFVVAVITAALVLPAQAAFAGPPQDVIEPTEAFACEGLPPYHCMNVKSQGNTGLILVFEPDPRGPSEGISFDPKSDSRPCPHDPAAADGTWWSPFEGAWVCHHKP